MAGETVESLQKEIELTCKDYNQIPIPADDMPTVDPTNSLAKCSSYELYYGFSKSSNPVKARLCAYRELEQDDSDDPFYGAGMLTTIYANGIGATRNLPLAIKFACKISISSYAELKYRISHLQKLHKTNWQGTNFSLCDDITSGRMQSSCADYVEKLANLRRKVKMEEIQEKWSIEDKSAFTELKKAADEFIYASSEDEIDQRGTALGAVITEHEAALNEEFLGIHLQLHRGVLPASTGERFTETDSQLNTVYRTIQQTKKPEWGTVSKEGIKATQRKWIKYRDAWVAFCKVKYPYIAPNSIKTFLTVLRIKMLKEFENNSW